VIEEIRKFIEWRGRSLGWDHQVGVVSLVTVVLKLASAFLSRFPAAGLKAAVVLGLGFSGLAVILVAVTIRCLDASVAG
jgi:hypothetical protein